MLKQIRNRKCQKETDHKSHASNIAGFCLLQISDFTANMKAVSYFNKACSQKGHLLVVESLKSHSLYSGADRQNGLFFVLNAALSFTISSTGKT